MAIKVSAFAKDFGMEEADIISMLNTFSSEPANAKSKLEDEECRILIEKILQNGGSHEEYLQCQRKVAKAGNTKTAKKVVAEPEEKKVEEVSEKPVEKAPVTEKPTIIEEKIEKTEAKTEKEAEKAVPEVQKTEEKPEEKPEVKPTEPEKTEAEPEKAATEVQKNDNAEPEKVEIPEKKSEAPEKPSRPSNIISRPGDRPSNIIYRPGDRPSNNRPSNIISKPGDRPSNIISRPGDRPSSKNAKPDRPADNSKPEKKPTKPQENNGQQKKGTKPNPAKKGSGTITVDTRTVEVDLDKYNTRYEDFAPTSNYMNDSHQNKQKIKQNSQKQQQQQQKKNAHNAKKETEAERKARIEQQRKQQTIKVVIGDEISVSDLAMQLKLPAKDVVTKLFKLGVMATMNAIIDFDTAAIVAEELDAVVEKEVVVTIEDRIIDSHEDSDDELVARSPVVVVMGHVDHGKTSILDALRNANVTATESGGITQHIGAYRVNLNGQDITFLDTPGHAAFTAMRARGAMATDVAILVVAADDGIMPQTIEAINHAKAAGVSIVVAINKMDKDGANPDRIMQQLTEYELVPEEWGGDTICVPVSAKTKMGLDNLLESVLLVAEMRELKANPNRAARGVIIEAKLDKGRGPVATLLVQNGTLHKNDIVVAGQAVGRVRTMTNDKGRSVKDAGPSVPVEITGLADVPNAGDTFDVVSDERLARELVEKRKAEAKEAEFNANNRLSLDNLFASLEQGKVKDLNIIVKADVQGSVEALKQNLEKLSNDEVRVRVIHGGVGAINESDVMLAKTSDAIIIGFHVRPEPSAQANAERDHVEMRMYMVIYDCLEDVEAAIKGMLAPKFRDVELGRVEVRQVFKLSTAGVIAGSYVVSGKVERNARVRVVRDGIVYADEEIASLRRVKDDVKEVAQGFECGIGLLKYGDIKEGDIFEVYRVEEYRD